MNFSAGQMENAAIESCLDIINAGQNKRYMHIVTGGFLKFICLQKGIYYKRQDSQSYNLVYY